MKGRYFFLKMIFVTIASSISSAFIFGLISIFFDEKLIAIDIFNFMFFGALISAIVGSIVGCPLVIVVDWKWSNFRSRYVVSAVVGAILGWLLLEGAFAKGAWNNLWTDSYFWHKLAPRRVMLFSAIGLLSGLLYTGFICLLDRLMPGSAKKPGI
ncbi:hypothetical protein [Xanthomonas oryzae]|uniref:hypothetical protein n=1 Tax=Xanthomonas oryzae TaxID=347 RepID=UPI0011F1A0A4|nr:hypothetical protein [Xanthomonas oryzae]MEC5080669.1 hypothetical protein [Xanthomonas oryzae pv. oryzicola]MEC5115585.1 hypothetical protein [Xanthomonas oryzae pv. oryzicola]QGH67678.1 hypothetical protein GHV42_21035 [Xanthomonas oryzae pv. oryzicola]UBB93050.1 hypothetical protein K2I41_21220 [Xanthomonas oryzae pv. oryzicola]WGY44302.1 hypothetical protein HED68_20910 [Xanthomonas oryzae pv. oryzicola]